MAEPVAVLLPVPRLAVPVAAEEVFVGHAPAEAVSFEEIPAGRASAEVAVAAFVAGYLLAEKFARRTD